MMKIKKLLSFAAAGAVGLAALTAPGPALGQDIAVTYNGTPISFTQPPVAVDGVTLVPMRAIFETLGMDVSWNGGDSSVTAVKNGKSAYVAVGSTAARINGQAVTLTQAPVVVNGTTLVPLRVISEAMGVDVNWDQENYTVAMTKEEKVSDDSWKEITGSIDLSSMTVDGPGLEVYGKTVMVTGAGDFTVTGTNGDAMIRVNSPGRVKLRLKGVNLSNTDGPAIFFEACDKGYITVSKDTENYLADGAVYTVSAKGTVFSNDDLEIQGGGKLTVVSSYNHAIASDDEIDIEEGTLTLTAAGDGIHANDGIDIAGGDITVTAAGDGVQSEDYVDITGGSVNITTTGQVEPSSGDFGPGGNFGGRGGRGFDRQLPEGQQFGGQQPSEGQPFGGQQPPEGQLQPPQGPPAATADPAAETYPSTKGIKAETNILVRGGSVTVNSADHCLKASGIIYVKDGVLTLTSQQGKGISAEQGLSVDGGVINVLKSTEGLESKDAFAVNGGVIRVNASDDGLNAGGTGGRDAGDNGHALYINGGSVYVDSAGDGLDANGSLCMTGGTAVINGPTNSGNGALDSGGSIVVKGGTLVASGAAGMAEYPRAADGVQPSLVYNLPQSQAAGELLRIVDASGNEVLTYRSSKPYQNIVISSPLLARGGQYSIYLGGGYEGGADYDGLLSGGTYTGGTLAETVALSETVTNIGSGFGGFGGFGGRGGRW